MILTRDANPEETLYCIGGRIIKGMLSLGSRGSFVSVEDVSNYLAEQYNISQMNYQLGLDWLYLAGVIEGDNRGRVRLCS